MEQTWAGSEERKGKRKRSSSHWRLYKDALRQHLEIGSVCQKERLALWLYVKLKNLQVHSSVPVTREELGKKFPRRM